MYVNTVGLVLLLKLSEKITSFDDFCTEFIIKKLVLGEGWKVLQNTMMRCDGGICFYEQYVYEWYVHIGWKDRVAYRGKKGKKNLKNLRLYCEVRNYDEYFCNGSTRSEVLPNFTSV